MKIQRAVARYHRLERRHDFEDDRTFGEFIGPLPPAVHAIFSCAAHRATAELDQLSAGCGIGLFALVWGGKGSLIARNLLGGAGQLPAALGRELGDRARTGCRVHAIRPDGADLVVHAGGEEIRARQVIVAAQAPRAAPLVAPVAEQAAAALARLTYGPFLSVAVETSETTAMPYDDVYAIATPGRVFDMFTNQAHALRAGGPRRPGGSLMLFAGAEAAAALMRESDEVIVERFLADLHELYPQTRGVIAGAAVQRWELGNVYARPGRGRLQAALEGALGDAPEPAPGRRLLRRAGEHGGRCPERARGRRTRVAVDEVAAVDGEARPAAALHSSTRRRRARRAPRSPPSACAGSPAPAAPRRGR